MKRKVLVVIDMQNDFLTGALGTAEAQAITEAVREKVSAFDGEVIFTMDTHTQDYLSTQEGRNLPVEHCIKGSWGWQLDGELALFCKEHGCRVYEKPTFGSTALVHDLVLRSEEIESIEFIGVCTDICVVSTARRVKAALSEMPLYVDPALCAGVTPERHKAALETMASCQIGML